ncbi:MAG: 16S rRNA (adenine(1518)-N(6)/adenine(1519)-N(6))-dimethyltransferase RsmA [Acidimicrobiia bacterium]|nr:16S rRNA (adenine(1518)-N(6)/adenine(1519)-N(6))-dimethyltransferase RsmA [Acidimicrobiia bacterium]
MTLTRREVLDLLERHDLRPSRALGQNFVTDPNTVRRIARLAAIGPGDHVVEVGAGLGSLTLALAETGASVTAVEADRYLVPALRTVVEGTGVEVVEADALRLDWPALLGGQRWVLVANLPYNIATPLILDLLEGAPGIDRMLVMVQREVADRLVAGPGAGARGAVSVKVEYWAARSVVGRVPATVFVPKPKVESALVRLDRHPVPPVEAADVDRAALFGVVERAFAQRRKMLRRSLVDVVDASCFEAAGVVPSARPEELSLDEWARLTRCAWSTPSPS